MARKVRIEYTGTIYHVMSRSDRRAAGFREDMDRPDFLKTWAQTCHKRGFEIQAYSRRPHPFHWVLRRQRLEKRDGA